MVYFYSAVERRSRGVIRSIFAPALTGGIRRKEDSEAEKDIRTQNQPVLVGFRSAYVFDVSQTDGAKLPELSERVKGNVGEYRERLIDFVIAQGIPSRNGTGTGATQLSERKITGGSANKQAPFRAPVFPPWALLLRVR